MKKAFIAFLLGLLVLSISCSPGVPQEQFQQTSDELDRAKSQIQELQTDLASAQGQLQETEEQLKNTAGELGSLKEQILASQTDLDKRDNYAAFFDLAMTYFWQIFNLPSDYTFNGIDDYQAALQEGAKDLADSKIDEGIAEIAAANSEYEGAASILSLMQYCLEQIENLPPGPTLISPENGAVLDNGRFDHNDNINWFFDWSDVPGATQYRLYVIHPEASKPVIDITVEASSCQHVSEGYIAGTPGLSGWTWRVKALIDGQWSRWSETGTFDVEPADTDPPLVPVTPTRTATTTRPPTTTATPTLQTPTLVPPPTTAPPVTTAITTYPPTAPITPTLTSLPVPALMSPLPGAIMDNGRSDGQDVITWDFDWGDVPGATGYQLYVIGSTAQNPVIYVQTIVSSYYSSRSGYIADQNRFSWTWKVRTLIGFQCSPWSETRTFDVEPLNTDPPRPTTVPAPTKVPTTTTTTITTTAAVTTTPAAREVKVYTTPT